jgi:hypothetical protein
VLGLYENNTVDFLPALFATDYTHAIQNGTYKGAHHCLAPDAFLSPWLGFIFSLYPLGLFTCGAWTILCWRTFMMALSEPLVWQIRSDFNEIHNLSIQIMLIFLLLISVVPGITLILMQLWAIGRAVPTIRIFTRAVRRRFLSDLATRIPPLYSQAYTQNTFLNQALTIRKYISMLSGFHPFQLILDQQFLEPDEHSSTYFCTCLVLPGALHWVRRS